MSSTSKEMLDLEKALSFALKKHNANGVVNKNHVGKGYVKERQYVLLKVRKVDESGAPYGNPIDFEYYSDELSVIGAEYDAKKEARSKGFVHWTTIDNRRVEVQK